MAANPAGDRFYLRDAAGALTTVDARSGRVRWSIASAAGEVAADGRRVYVARDGLTAYDAARGRRLWHRSVDDPGRPIRAGGLLYSTDAGRSLVVLSAGTGAKAAGGAAHRAAVDHVVVVGGRLYLHDGQAVRAYSP